VDVLSDESIRSGIKEYSQWPTIPQLYVCGEFIGGSDIMIEMYQTGDLGEMIEKVNKNGRENHVMLLTVLEQYPCLNRFLLLFVSGQGRHDVKKDPAVNDTLDIIITRIPFGPCNDVRNFLCFHLLQIIIVKENVLGCTSIVFTTFIILK
jgi:hypothetical protein